MAAIDARDKYVVFEEFENQEKRNYYIKHY